MTEANNRPRANNIHGHRGENKTNNTHYKHTDTDTETDKTNAHTERHADTHRRTKNRQTDKHTDHTKQRHTETQTGQIWTGFYFFSFTFAMIRTRTATDTNTQTDKTATDTDGVTEFAPLFCTRFCCFVVQFRQASTTNGHS